MDCGKYVSIRNFVRDLCDVLPSYTKADDPTFDPHPYRVMRNNSVVFVPTETLPSFFEYTKDKHVRIHLITGAGVKGVPREILAGFDWKGFVSSHILTWHTQNIDVVDHPQIYSIPLGIDFHTLSSIRSHAWGPGLTICQQEDQLEKVPFVPFWRRYNKVFVPVMARMSRNGDDRTRAYTRIPHHGSIVRQSERLTRLQLWRQMSRYQFVVSPLGMGMDCHRTWEALALGTVPILRNSTVAIKLFATFPESPVIIVNDWSEVNHENVTRWSRWFENASVSMYASMEFWKRLIMRRLTTKVENSARRETL